MPRIQVVLSAEDRERFRRQADRERMSLSAWLRAAGDERVNKAAQRVRFRSRAALVTFFDACDQREAGVEPDWDQHLEVISTSRRSGQSNT